jgi:glycosyltransferase involved in cell wall biosynthesis
MIYWRKLASNLADGYTYASDNISSRLKDIEVLNLEDISLSDHSVKSVSVDINSGIKFIPEPASSKILINNCLPCDYSYNGDYIVGFSYWETTKLPLDWVYSMNKCDEIWTTSSWAKECFINSGVEVPVYSFNLGVNTEVFHPRVTMKKDYNKFTFLHIGSPSTRKNTQLVVDAFFKLFHGNDYYRLIIKSRGEPDARNIVNGVNYGSLYSAEQVEIIDHYLTDEELAELISSSDCFLYPTMGEGWGMSPFQAIACGIPTICTNETACSEFAHLSVPLNAPLSNENQSGIYCNGEWATPKIDDLCDKMLYVINNYSEVLEKTMHSSNFIKDNYSWDSVVSDYRERILNIQDV